MKNILKAKERKVSGFAFLQHKFLLINKGKLKADVFDGSQIREFTKDPMLDDARSETELSAWQSLKSVVTNLPGNH